MSDIFPRVVKVFLGEGSLILKTLSVSVMLAFVALNMCPVEPTSKGTYITVLT